MNARESNGKDKIRADYFDKGQCVCVAIMFT